MKTYKPFIIIVLFFFSFNFCLNYDTFLAQSPLRLLPGLATVLELRRVNNYYVADIYLGTPSQKFEVQIDTAQRVSWVPSIDCTNCANDTKYNDLESSTAQDKNETYNIGDEDGDITGVLTYDSLRLGNLNSTGFAFVRANKLEQPFNDHITGKLGLSLGNRQGNKFNVLSNLKANGLINRQVFAIDGINSKLYLGEVPSEVNQFPNKYNICNATITDGLDDEYRDGWICELTHIFVGKNKVFNQTFEINGRALLDSAYEYISAPKVFMPYFKIDFILRNFNDTCNETVIGDETTFVCPKNIESSSDNELYFLFGGYGLRVAANDLFSKEGKNYIFNIRFSEEKHNIWTIGLPLLNNYLVVYDSDNRIIGFHGNDKVNFSEEWSAWLNGGTGYASQQHMKYLMIAGAILGALFLLLIIFLVVHSIKRKQLEEHGPLIDQK